MLCMAADSGFRHACIECTTHAAFSCSAPALARRLPHGNPAVNAPTLPRTAAPCGSAVTSRSVDFAVVRHARGESCLPRRLRDPERMVLHELPIGDLELIRCGAVTTAVIAVDHEAAMHLGRHVEARAG